MSKHVQLGVLGVVFLHSCHELLQELVTERHAVSATTHHRQPDWLGETRRRVQVKYGVPEHLQGLQQRKGNQMLDATEPEIINTQTLGTTQVSNHNNWSPLP